MEQLTLFDAPPGPQASNALRPVRARVRRPVAAWPEGAVAVTLWPRTRELAAWLAGQSPDLDVNALGTVMLVRMTDEAVMRWCVRLCIELQHTPLGWQAQRLFGRAACSELADAALDNTVPLPAV